MRLETAKKLCLDTTEKSASNKASPSGPSQNFKTHCILAPQMRKWHSTNPLIRKSLQKKRNKSYYKIFSSPGLRLRLPPACDWARRDLNLRHSQPGCSSTAREGASFIPLGSLHFAPQQEKLLPTELPTAAPSATPPASLRTTSSFQNPHAFPQAPLRTWVKPVMVQCRDTAGSGSSRVCSALSTRAH